MAETSVEDLRQQALDALYFYDWKEFDQTQSEEILTHWSGCYNPIHDYQSNRIFNASLKARLYIIAKEQGMGAAIMWKLAR